MVGSAGPAGQPSQPAAENIWLGKTRKHMDGKRSEKHGQAIKGNMVGSAGPAGQPGQPAAENIWQSQVRKQK